MTHIEKDIKINIKDIKVKTIIGVLDEERQNAQTLFIDVKIKFDASKSMNSDNIKDTIDYFELTKLIKSKVENSHFELLEKLLDFVLRAIMKINLVKEAKVTIHKPEALEKFGAVVSVSSKAKR